VRREEEKENDSEGEERVGLMGRVVIGNQQCGVRFWREGKMGGESLWGGKKEAISESSATCLPGRVGAKRKRNVKPRRPGLPPPPKNVIPSLGQRS